MSFPRSLRGHWYVRSPVLVVTACIPLGRCLVLVVTVRLQCLHSSLPFVRFRPTCMFLNRWYWDKVWGLIPHRL
ncbi:hypothetical protein RIR_jg20398.t1 [Rhizophagus irregularis DAOM 181602=DAOM 197198]|nr:hypothetical protein RIR_jg20398.t1 [Rhizophagus irregularis DAOM 181602=DAOM 197198]